FELTRGAVESPLLKWLGLVIALVIAGVGAGFGVWQGLPAQEIILFAAATFALVAWAWRFYTGRPTPLAASPVATLAAPRSTGGEFRTFVANNRALLISTGLLILACLIAGLTVPALVTAVNLISALVLLGLLVLAMTVSRFVVDNRSAF